jgi:hypothetical protein
MTTERKAGGLQSWGVGRDYWVRVNELPFLNRKVVLICPWFAVLLTDILAPDNARDPHDHSRWFASWILRGGYTEVVYSDPKNLAQIRRRRHRRWSWHVMRATEAHVIVKVEPHLKTLVLAGRSRGTWAFWTPRGKVDWKAYA